MEYSVSNITVMEGLDAVRMRPGMYIGTTGPKGLHHLLWEIVDNAVDEAANGYANEMETCNGTFLFLLNLVVHDASINTYRNATNDD